MMTPEQFRATRKSFGLTQKEWGQALGLSLSHTKKIEGGGIVTPTVALLIQSYMTHGIQEVSNVPHLRDGSSSRPD
jgi:predicted transcriptional regulator